MRYITTKIIERFKDYLISEEKAEATVKKYVRDVEYFSMWLGDAEVTKPCVLKYKTHLLTSHSATGMNCVISSLNSFFTFAEWNDLKVKTVHVQRQIFAREDRELSKKEYERLLSAAQKQNDKRLYLLMQCICATGIRVSELKYITIESTESGKAEIFNKGKRRIVFLPTKLCTALKKYAKMRKIKSGAIFIGSIINVGVAPNIYFLHF